MDCSSPVCSIHGILQARVLEWVAMPSSRGSSRPRDWTRISCIEGGLFTNEISRPETCGMTGFSAPLTLQEDRIHHSLSLVPSYGNWSEGTSLWHAQRLKWAGRSAGRVPGRHRPSTRVWLARSYRGPVPVKSSGPSSAELPLAGLGSSVPPDFSSGCLSCSAQAPPPPPSPPSSLECWRVEISLQQRSYQTHRFIIFKCTSTMGSQGSPATPWSLFSFGLIPPSLPEIPPASSPATRTCKIMF